MKQYIAAMAALMVVALVPIQEADAYSTLRSQNGSELRWYSPTVDFYLNTDGFQDFDPVELERATLQCVRTWEALNFGLRFNYKGLTHKKAAEGSDENIIYFEQDPNTWKALFPSQENALAMTRVWSDGDGAIEGFDMVFNDARHTFSNTLDPGLAKYDYLNTCVHEMGHVLGLDHSDIDDATMFATAATADFSKRDLATDDINGIRYLYRAGMPSEEDELGCGGVAMASSVSTGALRHLQNPLSRPGADDLPLWALLLALPAVWVHTRRR